MTRHSPDPLRALQLALGRHDADRRGAFAGVTANDLEADKRLWSDVGVAVANLAHRIANVCEASAFCAERPAVPALCARLVESFDDQVDPAAWTVIEAAARARLGR